MPVLCQPGSVLAQLAAGAGHRVVGEGFADRRYLPDGRLAPRSDPEALVTSAEEVPDGVVSMARQQRVVAVDGTVVPCPVESICVHGDTPGGVALAQRARAALDEAGVELAPFA